MVLNAVLKTSHCHFFAGRQRDIYNLENIPVSGDRWNTGYTQSGGNPALQKRRNADGSLKKCPIPLRIHADRFHLPALHSQKTLSLILFTSSAFTCSKVLLLVEYQCCVGTFPKSLSSMSQIKSGGES